MWESITKEDLLAFEKEVLGIYISGHPLEEYEEKWRQGDFGQRLSGFSAGRGEQNSPKVQDGAKRL